jgi:predicted DNA-binding transcriptional regulator AlpA
MAHAHHLRHKARILRAERQLTIDELSERLGLSRSTIYYWVRDLPIPGSGSGGVWDESARRKGNRAMQRKYRLLREDAYRQGAEEFENLAVDPTFRDFVCLYLAEGSKRNRNAVAICNSDAAVMQMSTRWLRALSSKPRSYWIQYHADQDLDELREFWGGLLGIDPGAIHLQRKSNSNGLKGRNWRSRHGVLTVRLNDTALRARIQAWMDRVRCEWG